MISDYIDMDTQKIRYVSESSNASTSGYSTMSPGPGSGGSTLVGGNLSPSSSTFSMPPSPAQSPATVLQTEFSNLNLPSNLPQQYQQTQYTLQNTGVYKGANNYLNFNAGGSALVTPVMTQLHHQPFGVQASVLSAPKMHVKNEYQAELRIIEHPVEKFRFRYKSEMHGTHGSLNGANSKRTPKTFPEVELRNFNGNAIIRCSLFQTNLESPHSHQLVVRKDDQDICDPHELHVSPEKGYVAQFQNMGIIHTAKKFIFDELLKKKMNRLHFELGRDELSTKQTQELHKETEKEAKDMNLNQVRLCFEAFQVDDNKTWTRIATPVYTNAINNRKSAQTGELRICRLSIATGSVSGGDDLILLVEKVSKKNIKVRFYEMNEDDEIVWEAFGRFRESDVHHQYAIVCQTPPYKDKEIDKPVEVCIELVRPSDDERSFPPVNFRYKPRDAVVSRKRRRTCSKSTSSSGSGSSLSSYEVPKTVQTANIMMGAPIQQASAMHGGQMGLGANAVTISEEFNKELMCNDLFRACINSNSEELSKMCPQTLSGFDLLDNDYQMQGGGHIEEDGATSSSSLSSLQSMEYKKMLMHKAMSMPVVNRNPYFQRIVKIYDDVRASNSTSDEQLAIAARQVADVFAEHAEKNEQCETIIHEIIAHDNPKVCFKICQIISFFKLNNELLNRSLNAKSRSGLHYACLYDRAHYIRPLLGLGCDPNLQDQKGDTALHIAVKEQHYKCIDSFLNMEGMRLKLTTRNDEGLSSLHLAIRQNSYDVAAKLLKHDKSAALVSNSKDGNNALHMAVLQQNIKLIKLILDGQNAGEMLITRNTAGHSVVDLAKSLGAKADACEIVNFLSSLCKDILDSSKEATVIKEEDFSSSSTEDDDDANEPRALADMITIKEEYLEPTEDLMTDTQNLEHILNDPIKFKSLTKLLDQSDKWKELAQKLKMQHLMCIFDNADDVLSYIKKKANIEYKAFVAALGEVHKGALDIL